MFLRWLLQVEEQMLLSVKTQTVESWQNYSKTKRVEWVTKWPGMVVLCVSQIFWSIDIQSRLQRKRTDEVKDYFRTLQQQLNETVALIRSKTISNLTRITIKALIVIDVHAKDVLEELVHNNVSSENDFQWLSQLRYYMMDDIVLVNIINASVPFAYEYLGNSDRLVITPLTDRCYRTLMGAYQLHLNGAPEGN